MAKTTGGSSGRKKVGKQAGLKSVKMGSLKGSSYKAFYDMFRAGGKSTTGGVVETNRPPGPGIREYTRRGKRK